MYKEMDREVKKDAEEEMNCILDLLEEWCPESTLSGE